MATTLLLDPYTIATAVPPAEDPAFTFTAADGDPWPSPWVSSPGGTGAFADVQGNRGRMVTATAGATYQASRAFYGATSYGDFDVTARLAFTNPKVSQFCSVVIHGDAWHASGYDLPTNGYNVQCDIGANTVGIVETNAGTWSTQQTVAKTYTAGADVWVKVNVVGARIRARVWDVGALEPATWDLDYTDTASPFLTGKWGLSHASVGSNVVCYWDDVTFAVAQTTGPYSHIGADSLDLLDVVSSSLGSGGGTAVQWDNAATVVWDNASSVLWGAGGGGGGGGSGPYTHTGADTLTLVDAVISTLPGGGSTVVQWDNGANAAWDNAATVSWS